MSVVADAPMSASAWRKLHNSLKMREGLQYGESQHSSLNTVLGASFDELGQEQRARFLKLAVLAHGVVAPSEMLRHLWGQVCNT